MTGTAILNMLFGAALVVLGVLATALADRLRGLRISHDAREPRASREQSVPAARAVIPVVEPANAPRKPVSAQVIDVEWRPTREHRRANVRIPVVEIVNEAQSDIVAALVQAGYKKAVAVTAASSCLPTEKLATSTWLKAALRRAQCSS